MAKNTEQLEMLHIGILIHQYDPTIDITLFSDMEELADHLNAKLGTKIRQGLKWHEVINELIKSQTPRGHDSTDDAFDSAMSSI